MLFVQNLQLNPDEDVRSIPGTEFTRVVVRLPNNLAPTHGPATAAQSESHRETRIEHHIRRQF